jgi:hypothetical protein
MEFYHTFFRKDKLWALERVVRQTSKVFRLDAKLREQTLSVLDRNIDQSDEEIDLPPYKRAKVEDDIEHKQPIMESQHKDSESSPRGLIVSVALNQDPNVGE